MPASARFPDAATWLVLAGLGLLPFTVATTLASQIAIFATGTLAVTLLLGAAGLLSFGQGLYFGLGAYVCGLMLRDGHADLLVALTAATAAGTVLSALLGAVIVRRQGVYFVMLTLAFAQMGYFAMLAFKGITGGENGLRGVPRELTFAWLIPVQGTASLYLLSAGGFLLAFLLAQRMLASPFGTVLVALRENPGRTEALGYDVGLYKTAVMAVAGGIAALSGALYAVFLGFVPPNSIEIDMSQRLLVMTIIGGTGSPAGALVGAAFYTIVSEILSELWPRWLALIALILIAIVLFLRGGLWSLVESGFALVRRRPGHA